MPASLVGAGTAPAHTGDEPAVASAGEGSTRTRVHDREATSRARAFILLRFTLIIATACLLLAEVGPVDFLWLPLLLFAAALASNIAALMLPAAWTELSLFSGIAVVGDTVWVTLALLATGKFTADFFYLYFFVLLLAAMGESLRLIALGVVVVCAAYVVAVLATGSASQVLETHFLIRLPFLFAVAIFYGYLVDRLRRERERARGERLLVDHLRESQSALEESNRALLAEITERDEARQALRRANERLQELTDIKSRFFTTVSHEVKTPLTAIKNALSLIRAGAGGSAGDPKLLDMIQRNADRLNLIISDMLDMSRVESGVLRIRAEPVCLDELLPPILASHGPKAAEGGVDLGLDMPGPLPAVWADRRRVEQVMTDLIGNALRATARGGRVRVYGRRLAERVELGVEDTGIGLTTDEQRRIFEPFYQVGNTLVGRSPGAGLGLTICRDLARGHGSELEVRSTPGEGSRFFFRLPVASARATEILELEDAMRSTFRRFPYFSLLVVTQPLPDKVAGDDQRRKLALIELRDRLKEMLPRAHDHFVLQPAHGRIVVVLLATPRDGGDVVCRRLDEALRAEPASLDGERLPAPRVAGPSCYPDDGLFGARLVEVALAAGDGGRLEEDVS